MCVCVCVCVCVCKKKWVESVRMWVEKLKRKKCICLMVCLVSNAFWLQYIYIYIYICVCVCVCVCVCFPWSNERKQVNNLKWVRPQKKLLLDYLFFFHSCFWLFTPSSGSKCFIWMFPFSFDRGDCFVAVFSSGFVSVNIQFVLIVSDKLSSLLRFFSHFFFSFNGWRVNKIKC